MSVLILAAVAAGGAVGAALRAAALRRNRASHRLPYATLAVNVAGSFLLGWMAGGGVANPVVAAGLGAGLLGGFTTYSTFAVEAATLSRAGRRRRSAAYIALSVATSIAAAGAGTALAP
ncbi:fluoride efflux transporter FluC [Paenibacillus antri]|uniref:fluoride efflux transporter FluC n=1 Tax=Paenibacillus antri TaxID=2582848 RepID=UPI001391B7DE|nr:CrcB family protein [Paenibacillus antri]